MTAYEVSERIKQYIREAMPLFEPMEREYNGALCETTFEVLRVNGAFQDVPDQLSGADVEFEYESPLSQAMDKAKVGLAREAVDLGMTHAQVDQSVIAHLDFKQMFRDAIQATGAPEEWLHSEDDADAMVQQQQMADQMQGALDQAEQVSAIE